MRLDFKLDEEDRRTLVQEVVESIKPLIGETAKEDQFLDVTGLAKYLKVSKDWVYKKVQARSIPYSKPGKGLIFRKVDIDLWLEERTVRPLSLNPAVNVLNFMQV